MDAATIFLGMTVGASTQADVFLTPKSIGIFVLGAIAFSVLIGLIMQLIYRKEEAARSAANGR